MNRWLRKSINARDDGKHVGIRKKTGRDIYNTLLLLTFRRHDDGGLKSFMTGSHLADVVIK